MQDLRLAVRSLRATPVIAAVAIVSLALGIGANTALFSLANSLLLRPLPIREPSRLVMISDTATRSTKYWEGGVWEDLRERTGLFDAMCAWAVTRLTPTDGSPAEPIVGGWVSGSYFQTLGVRAAVGRVLTENDDRPGGGANGPVMVISDAYWQRRFHRDPAVIGRSVSLDGVPVSIVGVTVPEFLGADIGFPFDALLPLADESAFTRGDGDGRRGLPNVVIFARLKPGQSGETAAQSLRAVQPAIRESTRPTIAGAAGDFYSKDYLKDPFTVVSAASGTSMFRRRYGPPLIALLGAAGLVLLVACGNIANVLLARASARRHELSVRVALGASRWRLVRQFLVESALLAGLASIAGVVVAMWASRLLVRQMSTQNMPIGLDLSFDWRLLSFAASIAAATLVIVGVTPAIQASSAAPIDALKEQGRGASGASGGRTADVLVVFQIAVSLVLVVAAGLFLRTFTTLSARDPGFARDRLLSARIDGRRAIDNPLQRLSTYEQVQREVAAVAGVSGAALSFVAPMSDRVFDPPIEVSGSRPLSARERSTYGNVISPGWFTTFGMSLRAGRDLTDGDRVGSEPVAVVNEAFARKFLNGASPLDHFITLPDQLVQPSRSVPIRIVGVVTDAVYVSMREPAQPTMYLPLAQRQEPLFVRNLVTVNLTVRTAGGAPGLMAKSIAAAIATVNPQLAVTFRPLADQIDDSLARERVVASLAGFFGVLALTLAGLGLYGVTANAVGRRRIEIGIRIALGASGASVIQLVLSRLSLLIGAGTLIGAGVSVWASAFVSSLLYGVEPRDPGTLIGAALTLGIVGGLAGWLPAWRAARLDPAAVLRDS